MKNMTKKPSEILREAVKLPWTQGLYARDKNGYIVSPSSPRAVSFCSVGRISRLCKSESFYTYEECENFLKRIIQERSVPSWNDAPDRTLEQVDAAFLEAAELAESEGQ